MNNEQKGIFFSWKREWPLLVLLLGTLLYGFYTYPSLPERVPSHWNIYGQIDGWSSAFWGAFGIPLLNLGMYLLLLVTPRLDPRKDKYVQFAAPYHIFRYVLHILLTGLYAVIIIAAYGGEVDVDRLVPMGISVILVVTGNYMGKIRQNYFFGFRTPWTLASEDVWRKTHRFAGPLWVVAGLISFAAAFVGGLVSFVTFFSLLAVIVIVPFSYSYWLYRKVK